jgi:hypothetical protein
VDIAVCVPSGPHALLILYLGRILEIFVDGVVFLDIFVWFLTGDIDVDTHAIVPKPFFTRCIIPGTLVQILDHPTLPDLLPSLLRSTLKLSSSIGYSRCIRWFLALMPAMKIVVIDPMIGFFFQHIKEEDEGFFMQYAESMGIISPERRSGYFSDATFGRTGSKRHFHRVSSDQYNTSQVGLSLFDDEGIQSMLSTESSGSFNVMPMQSPSRMNSGIASQAPSQLATAPATPPLQNSPSRKNRSVQFILHDDVQSHSHTSTTTTTSHSSLTTSLSSRKSVSVGEYSLSYSENSLPALDDRWLAEK